MAKFSEIVSFVTIALVITTVSCFPASVETEAAVADTAVAVGTGTDVKTTTGEHESDSAPPAEAPGVVEEDSDCDCNDEEALCHKSVRQLIDFKFMKGKDEFLKEFRIRKICGSDGNIYNTSCEFKCAQAKAGGETALSIRRCKRSEDGQLKGREKYRKKQARPTAEKTDEKMASVQAEPIPHPLVCICPRNYYPICASNGITYGNRCVFQCAKDNLKDVEEITIVNVGTACNESDQTIVGRDNGKGNIF